MAQHYGVPVINYAKIVSKHNKLDNATGPDRLWPLLIGGDMNQAFLTWAYYYVDVMSSRLLQLHAPATCAMFFGLGVRGFVD